MSGAMQLRVIPRGGEKRRGGNGHDRRRGNYAGSNQGASYHAPTLIFGPLARRRAVLRVRGMESAAALETLRTITGKPADECRQAYNIILRYHPDIGELDAIYDHLREYYKHSRRPMPLRKSKE